MAFSRQEYWNVLPCPPLGDLPNPGIEPAFLISPALAASFFTTRATWEDLWSLEHLLLFLIAMEIITNSRDEHTDPIVARLFFGIGWHLVNPTTLKPHRLAVQNRMTIKPWWKKSGFPILTSRGHLKYQGYERKGRHSRKLMRSVWSGRGIYSFPRRLVQPTPSHPQVFEVCYLDSELSQAWQEGRGGCVVWQRAGQGAEGWTWIYDWLTPPLMPGIAPFSPVGKWGKNPSQDRTEKSRCLSQE